MTGGPFSAVNRSGRIGAIKATTLQPARPQPALIKLMCERCSRPLAYFPSTLQIQWAAQLQQRCSCKKS